MGKTFTNVDFEDGYGKIISPTFSDLFVWNEDNQEYVYDENVLDYAQKMYDKCRNGVFSSFLRKLIKKLVGRSKCFRLFRLWSWSISNAV